ncbi:hypothetical protein [Pseudanabaena sp. SR411]|nr:hypothetical protein [Pseudanabaena sp. SR411]
MKQEELLKDKEGQCLALSFFALWRSRVHPQFVNEYYSFPTEEIDI